MSRKRNRKRRRPIPDRYRAGASRLVPFVATENAVQRHRRRFDAALSAEFLLREWCSNRGLTLDVHNNGHHWIMRRSAKMYAQWWPASAKLVLGQQYRAGIHCHDWVQVAKVLYRQLHK